MLFGKPTDEITESDLQELVKNQIPEDQTLEYKRKMYDHDKALDLLKDVTSLANAFGGTLLIGVAEGTGGVAGAVESIDDVQAAESRIVHWCLSSIHPRLQMIVKPIPLADGNNNVLLLHIPKGLQGPHMILYKDKQAFWKRHGRQQCMMSVEEIAEEFLRASALRASLEEVFERREKELLVEAKGNPVFVISAAPIFIREDVIEIDNQRVKELMSEPPKHPAAPEPLFPESIDVRPTFWGLEAQKIEEQRLTVERSAYSELMEMGPWPGSVKYENEEHERLPELYLAQWTLNFLTFFTKLAKIVGLYSAMVVKLGLYNVQGFVLSRMLPAPFKSHLDPHNLGMVEHQRVTVGPVQVSYNFVPEKVAKLVLDRVWNAVHFDKCPYFNEKGKVIMPS